MAYPWSTGKRRICISFDYEHDRHYRFLLSALKANARSAIDFEDLTPGAIDTLNVGRVKARLTHQIRQATHLLVVVGAHANVRHPDAALIGTRNWQWWEIEKAKAEGKSLIVVKLSRRYVTPTPLIGADASWAMSFTVPAILKAIRGW